MKLRYILPALAIVSFAGSCEKTQSQAPQAPAEENLAEAAPANWSETLSAFQAFADTPFAMPGAAQTSFDAVNAALPELVSIGWDATSFDTASGATLYEGLAVTINTEPAFGLRAEEAKIWGMDGDFVAARLRGERLDESGVIIERMEMTNLSYFGVANAVNTLFDTFASSIEEEGDIEDVDFALDTFEVTTDRAVFGKVSLRPYEYAPAPDSLYEFMDLEEDEAEGIRTAVGIAQKAVAAFRSVAYEDGVLLDSKVSVKLYQGGGDEDISIDQLIGAEIGLYGYEDVAGFDIGRAIIVDSTQAQGFVLNDGEGTFASAGFTDGIKFHQEETFDYASINALELDRLMGFLALGKFPGMEEKDLLSLGIWTTEGYSLKMNDGEVFTADSMTFDGEAFSWFIPNNLSFEIDGAAIELETIAEFALGFVPDALLENQPEATELLGNVRQAVAMLDENGLKTIPFDFDIGFSWDDGSGETGSRYNSMSEGFGENAASFDITLLAYDTIQAAMAADDKEAAFEDALMQSLVFGGARYFEADDGGYDKLFNYAIAVGQLFPQEGWGAMVGNMTPEQMRGLMALGIRSAKAGVAQELPMAADWVESFAKYYETSGGSIEAASRPTVRIDVAYLDSIGASPDAQDANPDPEKIVDDFGISVTYTPE